MSATVHDQTAHAPAPGSVPVRASGVELLGEVEGSGYERSPSLVRRADGQILQLTPVLYAVLDCIDGQRDVGEVAAAVVDRHGLAIEEADLRELIDGKLRPLGVLQGADGVDPLVERSNPLLALRWRVIVSNPRWTTRIAAPFARLFAPATVIAVLVAFTVLCGWLLFEQGLAAATRQALYQPALLLLVIGLSVASAAFHEIGHAAACHRAGATPGAMGAGLYLLWPAFYTDVSDSYRLNRRDRLRVDLGGLYFNAVFALGVFAAWALTGADALLVIVPVQLLQMLRQLMPFVRFDGYHVLADLTGVPDLFSRIKPTLLALLPSRWGQPDRTGLKPWARRVIAAWVLTVVPVLALSLVLMVIAFPRVAATTWDSLGNQLSGMAEHWSEGQLARAGLGLFSIVAISLPVLSMGYLLARVANRTSRRMWDATADRPVGRVSLVLAALCALVVLGSAWWPDGQYEPIHRNERGTVLDVVRTARERGGPAGLPATDADADGVVRSRPRAGTATDGRGAGALLAAPRARHTFTPPTAPGEGDNQALAVNYEDGGTLYDASPSLVWATDDTVTSRNQGYALASCTDCTTVAVAFQVVLIVGDADRVAPVNEAVAVNHTCLRCRTSAVAMQTVLSLPGDPTSAQLAQLDQLWAEVEDATADLPAVGVEATYRRLLGLEARLAALFGPEVRELAADHDVTDAPPTVDPPAEPTTDSTGTTDSSTTSSSSTSSTSSSTTSTTAPTTTTTTSPTTTTTTAPP